MGNVALRVEGLGKMYRIGGKHERYKTLRESITEGMAAPFRRARGLMQGQAYAAGEQKEEIWALQDVSFEIKHGEAVGIIGRNGAGKSTLLKILSRITEPTKGYADIYGRVGALLEVGTGFHQELTGRENIYLNGAILGMSRVEIDRRFDEIVDFSGVEKFIDTPVKHYSSGMGLRLGFAVAAHLEPEILVVDEVLAVGDAEFQKKCLGKMSDVTGQGRTVLFVSHNMTAVDSLCQRGIVFEQGHITSDTTASEAIEQYLNGSENHEQTLILTDHPNRRKKSLVCIQYLQIVDSEGKPRNEYITGESFTFKVGLHPREPMSRPHLLLGIDNSMGQRVFTLSTKLQNIDLGYMDSLSELECQIDNVPLAPGRYRLKLAFGSAYEDIDVIDSFDAFGISERDYFTSGKLPNQHQGIILVKANWDIHAKDNMDDVIKFSSDGEPRTYP